MSEETCDLRELEVLLETFQGKKYPVIPILQKTQSLYGYLPQAALRAISEKTGIALSQLMGVATFYAQFRLTRQGRHLIRICDGTACHVRGAPQNIEAVEDALNVPAGGTSPDYKYSMEIVYCLGSCGLAPIAVVNDQVYGKIDPKTFVEQLKKLE
ncbi:MAG: NAD(P)H-dependent oxidoreductase subunit E [Anaerolineae bacterium]|nr:MAG: NAD(P)H-dependent oxidoreductase subunit E [Anaerolineae bacterium]